MEHNRPVVAKTEDAVLDELQARQQRPSDLLEKLAREGYPTFQIKQALTHLLDEARIELTDKRMLRTRR
ncbi:MAG: hypothetical protein ACRD8U_04875 [Pyrinomonadaceae bacterium]